MVVLQGEREEWIQVTRRGRERGGGTHCTGARKLRRSERAICAGTANTHTTLLVLCSAGFVLSGSVSGSHTSHRSKQYLSLKRWITPLVTSTTGIPEKKGILSGSSAIVVSSEPDDVKKYQRSLHCT